MGGSSLEMRGEVESELIESKTWPVWVMGCYVDEQGWRVHKMPCSLKPEREEGVPLLEIGVMGEGMGLMEH